MELTRYTRIWLCQGSMAGPQFWEGGWHGFSFTRSQDWAIRMMVTVILGADSDLFFHSQIEFRAQATVDPLPALGYKLHVGLCVSSCSSVFLLQRCLCLQHPRTMEAATNVLYLVSPHCRHPGWSLPTLYRLWNHLSGSSVGVATPISSEGLQQAF